MMQQLISEHVDINVCPQAETIPDITNVTIGDLHGNAIKLLFFLVYEGICEISDREYQRLVKIYQTPVDELTRELLNEFETITDEMPIANGKLTLRFIGDEVCDRGNNDYFTLILLKKLHKEKVPFEILVSNHGVGFIESYESKSRFVYPRLGEDFASSLYSLQSLIDRNRVSRKEILTMVDAVYKPSLKALSYTLDLLRNKITIFSHAAIDISVIQSLAAKFKAPFADNTVLELATTIDAINQKFAHHIVSNSLHTLYDNVFIGKDADCMKDSTNPFDVLVWNRDYTSIYRNPSNKNYFVNFVHGHDLTHTHQLNVFCLDNMLGKTPDCHSGTLDTLVSEEILFVPRDESKPTQEIHSSSQLPEPEPFLGKRPGQSSAAIGSDASRDILTPEVLASLKFEPQLPSTVDLESQKDLVYLPDSPEPQPRKIINVESQDNISKQSTSIRKEDFLFFFTDSSEKEAKRFGADVEKEHKKPGPISF